MDSNTKNGFTLPEFMIAMSIGLGILAATASSYLFITKNGRALEAQIDFGNRARVLQSRFSEIIEQSYRIQADGTETGIEFFYNGDDDDSNSPRWIGYVEGAGVADSAIVYRPNGSESSDGEQVLCRYVGPAYSVDGETPAMFDFVSGMTVLLNVHIGDAEDGEDTTGPGRQGVVVSIVGTSRDQRRSL